MTESKLRPRVVLWWGIGLTAGGLLLSVLVPQLFYTIALPSSGPTRLDEGLLTVLDLFTRVLAQGVVPVGAALIGAGVVMAYVARVAGARTSQDDHMAQNR